MEVDDDNLNLVASEARVPEKPWAILQRDANGAYRVGHLGSFLLVLIVAQVLDCRETLEMVLCGRPRGGVACLFALSLSP